MNQLHVPSKIKLLIGEKPFIVDDIGMSGNQVLIFEDMVLKIDEDLASMAEQVQVMQWLEGKISVPQVIEYEEEQGKCYGRWIFENVHECEIWMQCLKKPVCKWRIIWWI